MIVLDVGSQNVRGGFEGDVECRANFPNIIGTPKTKPVMFGIGTKIHYVGDECMSKKGFLQVHHPMHRSLVVNWDAMEQILFHTFYNELRVAPEEQKLVMTKNTHTPMLQDEKYCTLLLEQFAVPTLCLVNSSVMALYSRGISTGVAVECGHGMIHAVPVYHGKPIYRASMQWNFGGYDVTNYFIQSSKLTSVNTSSAREIMNEKKHSIAFTLSSETRCHNSNCTVFELPDGTILQMTDLERYSIMEPLFNPSLYLKQAQPGIQDRIHQMLQKLACDNVTMKEAIAKNISITGGLSTNYKFFDRIVDEVYPKHPGSSFVDSLGFGAMTAWVGASMFGSNCGHVENIWITKQDYQEYGPNIVHKRCI